MIQNAEFIASSTDLGTVCPVFQKEFFVSKKIARATLNISSLGVYEAVLNGSCVETYFLAPGWTSYSKRLQYQSCDVTELIRENNVFSATVGNGWCLGRLAWTGESHFWADTPALIALLYLEYEDGTTEKIMTDKSWRCAESPVRFSELYDGETYDARITPGNWQPVRVYNYGKSVLIPQEGEEICEIETVEPVALIHTPKGETVLDFGQNLVGHVRFCIHGKPGDVAELSHAEILDKDGNFYIGNLRSAKQKIRYICDGGEMVYQPHFSFQGYRYVRIDRWPGEVNLSDFTSAVISSNMERTGFFECSNPKVNQLYQNIIWSQKGNFVDIPTDCPQRDERLGWTGDAQVFTQTATYNYDVETFFRKWLHDLKADQFPDGRTSFVVPYVPVTNQYDQPNMSEEQIGSQIQDDGKKNSSAWADAAVICPWQIYLAYGDPAVLEDQFDSMKAHIDWVRQSGDNEFLWNTGFHLADWLAVDAPEGTRVGPTDPYLISTAYYAYSTSLFVKAGKVLGRDMTEYEALYQNIRHAFQQEYVRGGRLTSDTQTAYVIALFFDLIKDKTPFAARLAELIRENGNKLKTGFLGTAHLLLALSQNGYDDVAYSLLLQEEFPSWLYSVNQGATTIWEHWDSLRPDGSMWSDSMNSFNHYSYGAVAAWMYSVMCGINPVESSPGYKHILLKPVPDRRMQYARASLKTKYGTVKSSWERCGDSVTYRFTVPEGSTATVELNGLCKELNAGEYEFTL